MKQSHFDRRRFLALGGALGAAARRAQAQSALATGKPLPAASAQAGKTGGDLSFASAHDAAQAIRRRKISSVELTQHLLSRIGKYNPKVNAIVTLLPEKALARAKAADDAFARGESWGPFHGVPVDIKDTFETAGVRTTAGSASFKDYVPASNSAVVDRLLAAGAILIGKSNVPAMAMDWQTTNELFGTTNNPWDLGYTPGGSTGGGAAAVAAGLGYLSVGSDIGGSIRIPAHFCGIFGHKPSLNVVPTRGHIPPLPTTSEPPPELNVAGPLARSATDLRIAMEVLGGPEGDEAKAYRWSLPAPRGLSLADYRAGVVLDDPLCPVSSEVGSAISDTVDALQKAGVRVERGWPEGLSPQEHYDAYRFLLFSYTASFLGAYKEEGTAPPSGLHSHQGILSRAGAATYAERRAATEIQVRAKAIWHRYFETHDIFLMPVSFVSAFRHDTKPTNQRTLDTSNGPRDYMDLLFWVTFATFAGLPATVAPVGFTPAKLPLGIQIVGPYLEDATPIDFAERLADLRGGYQPPQQFL